ncbi:hypothetical protein OIU77_012532 [Salix suchowensis]|uniref:Mitochondrial substrate carrier family protein n=1 Tax=Salix suchowensis TaxID=1278906 RepID=A0ABQ9A4K7_9ROSI|nr:hypothetical protein OIU77_012532 [Salix suchowensis]
MQTEARVGVVAEGGPRALNSEPKKHRQLQQQHQQSQIGTVSHLVAGGVAGALSKTCTAPLARLTILFQLQGMHSDVATLRKASIWHEASRVIREEGFSALWKGNLVTIAHRLPYSSVNFYAYERYKQLLHMIPGLEIQRKSAGVDLLVHFVGGGLAGITAASATYPLDLVRTCLAAQTNVIYYRGIHHALKTISREEGVFGLYKGLGATLLGVGPSIAISFSVYESLRSFWQSRRPHDSTVAVSLACGSLSGIASSTGLFSILMHGSSLLACAVIAHIHGAHVLFVLHTSSMVGHLLPVVRGILVEVCFSPRLPLPTVTMGFGILSLCCQDAVHRFLSDMHVAEILFPLDLSTKTRETTFPLDLVRRRKQLEGAGGRARVYTTGLLGTFKHIIQTEGFQGLYRGIMPEYCKVVPGVGICFMTYETLKLLFGRYSKL